MKILVVSQYYSPESFRINDICENLVTIGHDVTVLTGLPNYPSGRIENEYRWFRKRRENINDVKILRVPLIGRGKGFFRLALNYVSFVVSSVCKILVLKKDYDIVFVYQLSPITMAIPALLYKKLTGKKVLLYCLDLWPESISIAGINNSSVIYNILLRLSKFIYKSVDKIMVSSMSFLSYFDEIIGISSSNIEYMPQYAEDIYSEELVYKSVDGDLTNLMFAGNIGEWQSIDTIIKAAEELREYYNIKWHIVGDGSARRKCELLANELGLTNVIFYGHRAISDMPELYSKSDALLITLKNSPFVSKTLPGKIQSYMAAGRPILGAINGEAKLAIQESGCGLCCEAEDYKEFARIIMTFIEHPDKHESYGINARFYYEKNFSKEAFFHKFHDNL